MRTSWLSLKLRFFFFFLEHLLSLRGVVDGRCRENLFQLKKSADLLKCCLLGQKEMNNDHILKQVSRTSENQHETVTTFFQYQFVFVWEKQLGLNIQYVTWIWPGAIHEEDYIIHCLEHLKSALLFLNKLHEHSSMSKCHTMPFLNHSPDELVTQLRTGPGLELCV